MTLDQFLDDWLPVSQTRPSARLLDEAEQIALRHRREHERAVRFGISAARAQPDEF